jgi:hypothetical protein
MADGVAADGVAADRVGAADGVGVAAGMGGVGGDPDMVGVVILIGGVILTILIGAMGAATMGAVITAAVMVGVGAATAGAVTGNSRIGRHQRTDVASKIASLDQCPKLFAIASCGLAMVAIRRQPRSVFLFRDVGHNLSLPQTAEVSLSNLLTRTHARKIGRCRIRLQLTKFGSQDFLAISLRFRPAKRWPNLPGCTKNSFCYE